MHARARSRGECTAHAEMLVWQAECRAARAKSVHVRLQLQLNAVLRVHGQANSAGVSYSREDAAVGAAAAIGDAAIEAAEAAAEDGKRRRKGDGHRASERANSVSICTPSPACPLPLLIPVVPDRVR